MNKKITLLIIALSICFTSFSQETEPKTGWNFGVLPALGFDSNLGLMYGMGKNKLMAELGLMKDSAEKLIKQ